jgi:hypothetical protein
LCDAKQDHVFAGSLSQVLHNLNDSKDVVYISSQVDITRDMLTPVSTVSMSGGNEFF